MKVKLFLEVELDDDWEDLNRVEVESVDLSYKYHDGMTASISSLTPDYQMMDYA